MCHCTCWLLLLLLLLLLFPVFRIQCLKHSLCLGGCEVGSS
jgi:hypothetical protein